MKHRNHKIIQDARIRGFRLFVRRLGLILAITAFLILIPGIVGWVEFEDPNALLNTMIALAIGIFAARHG